MTPLAVTVPVQVEDAAEPALAGPHDVMRDSGVLEFGPRTAYRTYTLPPGKSCCQIWVGFCHSETVLQLEPTS